MKHWRDGLLGAFWPDAVYTPKPRSGGRAYSSINRSGKDIATATSGVTTGIPTNSPLTFFVVTNLTGIASDTYVLGRAVYKGGGVSGTVGASLRFYNAQLEIDWVNTGNTWCHAEVASAVQTGIHSYAGVMISDGSTLPKLYRDGTLLTLSTNANALLAYTMGYDASIDLGGGSIPGGTVVTGTIAGTVLFGAIYTKALTDSDILWLHNNWRTLSATVPRSLLDYAPAISTPSGSANFTEARDTLSGAGSIIVQGSLARTENRDTLSGVGGIIVQGSLTKTENRDTLVGSGGGTAAATASITDARDTLVGTGLRPSSGTVALTEARDTLVGAGNAGAASGTTSITEARDTLSGVGVGSAPTTSSNAYGGGGGGGHTGWDKPSFERKKKLDQDFQATIEEALRGESESAETPPVKFLREDVGELSKSLVEPPIELPPITLPTPTPGEDEDEEEELLIMFLSNW